MGKQIKRYNVKELIDNLISALSKFGAEYKLESENCTKLIVDLCKIEHEYDQTRAERDCYAGLVNYDI